MQSQSVAKIYAALREFGSRPLVLLRKARQSFSPHPRPPGLDPGTADPVRLVIQLSALFHWRHGWREAKGEGRFGWSGLIPIPIQPRVGLRETSRSFDPVAKTFRRTGGLSAGRWSH